jgi:hypothetical protein
MLGSQNRSDKISNFNIGVMNKPFFVGNAQIGESVTLMYVLLMSEIGHGLIPVAAYILTIEP